MFNYDVFVGSPWYLLLLAPLPLLWWFSFRRLALLGRVRRWVVIALRSIVLLLLILALADIQMVRTSDRLTVIYLLDQSLSIPVERRRAMVEYVNSSIREHREGRDRAGVIVFGRDAAIEIPPFDDDVQISKIESELDPEYTNLAAAMKLAQAAFPEDAAKRIVLVSDGNQNLGDVIQQAQGVRAAGIGIDVVPVHYRPRSDVGVERLVIPRDIRLGEPFDVKVVVTNTAQPTADGERKIPGKLVLSRLVEGRREVLNKESGAQVVTLQPGKKAVFPFRDEIDSPNLYTYEARFIPDPGRPEDDVMPQNNRATAYTHVRGTGRVLLIVDRENPGEFNHLIDRLGQQKLEVTKRTTNQLFSSLAELQPYDTVVLANVPRVAGEGDDVVYFTDDQIRMLVRNTQQMGAGLVMLGGPNGFGAGGWTGTELEKAMPVDFQIKSTEVVPVGALALVIDRSGSMTGQKIELSKQAAIAGAKTLGERDYVGVVAFDSSAEWVVPIRRVASVPAIARRIAELRAGGGTNMYPGMVQGYQALSRVDASAKHMIVLSDGRTTGSNYDALAATIRKKNITISTVAIGPGADFALLHTIATIGGGKFHRVTNPKALPRILIRETRRVARSLIWEREKDPVRPRVWSSHELIRGLDDPLPPIEGFVLTSVKDNDLAEVHLVAPQAAGERNSTILASWTYGLGRVVAFTSDCGARWTCGWTEKPIYDKLFAKIVRWSMRPAGESSDFTLAADVEDRQVRVVVTALDEQGEFLNFLSTTGNAVGPDLRPVPMELEQTAPGRYVGTFPARDAGSYFVAISTISLEGEADTIRTGINVPYSDEFREREANHALLKELAKMVPKGEGGEAGEVIEAKEDAKLPEALLAKNTFRHAGLPKATSSQDVWYYLLLLGGCLFFFDVFFRRVQVSLAWVPPLAARLRDRVLRREPQPVPIETIERLRSRKAEVGDRIEQLRSGARFEPPPQPAADVETLEEPASPSTAAKPPTIGGEEKPEEESYTERLLRAKKKVWNEPKKE